MSVSQSRRQCNAIEREMKMELEVEGDKKLDPARKERDRQPSSARADLRRPTCPPSLIQPHSHA